MIGQTSIVCSLLEMSSGLGGGRGYPLPSHWVESQKNMFSQRKTGIAITVGRVEWVLTTRNHSCTVPSHFRVIRNI